MFYIYFLFSGERRLAEYFEKYVYAMNNTGKCYRRPLAGQPIRYGTQVIGINKLKTMMKCICDRAGLIGTYSSHSGKRTCDTRCQEHEI